MKIKITQKLILQGITGGALGLALLTLLVSIVAFNGEDYYHDDKLGFQFGMQVDVTEGQIYVWMHVPRALYIKTTIVSVTKIEDDGTTKSAGLVDLFPVSDSTRGAIVIRFEIYSADEEVMPDLANRTQSLSPMVNILKESELPAFLRYVALIGITAINYWTFFTIIYLGGSFLAILLGFALLIKIKLDSNRVMEIEEESKEGPD